MSLPKEIEALRRHLDELAHTDDDELTARYWLQWPRKPAGLYWQVRWLVALVLRLLESMGIWRPDPWPVVLKMTRKDTRSKPVLIWAVGTDSETLREACAGFSESWERLPGYAPVLVTDVADFAFFSRLGWLVEYLPRLAGQGEPYDKRKARFVARLYYGAPALPVAAGLGGEANDIRRWVADSTRTRACC